MSEADLQTLLDLVCGRFFPPGIGPGIHTYADATDGKYSGCRELERRGLVSGREIPEFGSVFFKPTEAGLKAKLS